MNLTHDYISYRKEDIFKEYPNAFEVVLNNYRFSNGIKAEGPWGCITWGKMPGGRYVYLSRWQIYSLRQLI